MSIAKAIIEALGGTIGFTTEVGQGTVFFFELPIYQDPVVSSDRPELAPIPDVVEKSREQE